MGSEPDPESSSTPKLSLFSLPSKLPEPPGTLTPPLRSPASVPFRWEEAPGKPRTYTTTPSSKASSGSGQCLELPPRLFTDVKVTNMPSPTTVLDGPFVGRSVAYCASFSGDRHRPFISSPERGYSVGSWRWKVNRQVGEDSFDISSCSSRFAYGDGDEVDGMGNTKVKITRLRSRSFLSLSNSRSHFWASIYGTFKQVIPWRTKKSKKCGPST